MAAEYPSICLDCPDTREGSCTYYYEDIIGDIYM